MSANGFATQLSLGVEPPHDNRNLFSDHYLDVLLQSDPRWQAAVAEAESFRAWLAELYAAEGDHLPGYNEHQLETHWFRPIFERLGHVYEGQASVPGLGEGVRQPDYVFFPDEAARQAAAGAQGTAAYADDALAVGEVKRWGVALGKKVKGGGPSFDDQNPSYQIDYYLKATGLDWGILSNGRRWRLVHRESSQRLTVYYEVDLLDLLANDDDKAILYFTLFFRQASFRPDANGRVFLDDALRASSEYALALEEDLQDNVYRALEQLMQGFLDLPQNDLGAADLPAVYDNCLILLYRLLFIFYAESRELLPVRNHEYREHHSLGDLGREIADDNVPTAPFTTDNWNRLKTLFHIVNGDNEALNRHLGVPRYNGGLFSTTLHPFLEEKAVGDRAVVRAVDLLARRETGEGGKREAVDYRTLGVRQLGSVYEGLLEYRPRLAAEDVVAVRESGREEVWLPAGEAAEGATIIDRRRAGQVYLATDRGERKATGSYYTPQYIVAYIVENTLGPLVEAIATRAHERHAAAGTPAERDAAAQTLVDDVLDLKVLDPAMGSGHFLVEATDFLARELATDPIVQRPAGLAGEGDATLEEDVVYWRRRVVERCIYGVDKNPLAVELAKLSLWLNTVAADQPLSFLDHHLQCGDSLVGADVADLGWAPPVVLDRKAQKQMEKQKAGQMNLFQYRLGQQLPAVLGKVLEITGRESDSYESVQAKEAADEAVRQLKAPFAAVADLWTSAYFGNEYGPADYGEALDALATARLWQMPAVQRAREIAADRRFFHWHLAFPEVFYDENGQPRGEAAGFDAVVGNPPYVRQEGLSHSKPIFEQLYEVYAGTADLYVYFIERSVFLLRSSGVLGLITSNKFIRANYGAKLRRFLSQGIYIRQLIDFAQLPIFGDITVRTVILLLDKVVPEDRTSIFAPIRNLDFVSLANEVSEVAQEIPTSAFENENWTLTTLAGTTTLQKMEQRGVSLKDYLESNIRFGIKTGLNEAFIVGEDARNKLIAQDPTSAELLRPIVVGSNIGQYRLEFENQYLVWTYSGVEIDRYPAILGHLSQYQDKLDSRWDKGEHWYELRPCTYYEEFGSAKIIYPDIAEECRFTIDEEGFFSTNTAYFFNSDDRFLLAVLNSQISYFYFLTHCAALEDANRRSWLRFWGQYMEEFPVHASTLTVPADERERLLEKGQKLYERYCEKDDLACVTGFVEHELEQGRGDVVHDLLAFLAERMIAMNKEKQQVVEDFWLDLEGAADPDTFDTLRNRGKWESSLWKAEPCRPFVDEESRSTRHLDDSLGWNEACYKEFVKMLAGSIPNLSQLVRVYRQHHPPYAALAGRLAATDHLIDQIVYRLYGLTDEEIAIVEGAS